MTPQQHREAAMMTGALGVLGLASSLGMAFAAVALPPASRDTCMAAVPGLAAFGIYAFVEMADNLRQSRPRR